MVLLLSVSCSTQFGKSKLHDGWYLIIDNEENTVKNRPIATANKFDELKIDSVNVQGSDVYLYTITGKVSDVEKWAKETEKAIGSNIGFIYEGKMICNPKVNAAIESGNFMINFPPYTPKKAVEKVYEDLKKQKGKKLHGF